MADNSITETVSCPIRGFSPAEFPSSNNYLFKTENQNSSSLHDEKKESSGDNCLNSKENSSFSLLHTPLASPKLVEENQDSTDEGLVNPDLHNGHSSSDSVNNTSRNKNLGELLQEQNSEDLQDTLLMDSSKDSESQGVLEGSNTKEDVKDTSPTTDSLENNDLSNSNQDTEFSEGFNLHLSETQTFLPPEKETNSEVVSESEEESNDIEEESNDKTNDETKAEPEDVEMSNESSNTTSTQDVPDGKENITLVPSNSETENTKESEPDLNEDSSKMEEEIGVKEDTKESDNSSPKEESLSIDETNSTGIHEDEDSEPNKTENKIIKEENSESNVLEESEDNGEEESKSQTEESPETIEDNLGEQETESVPDKVEEIVGNPLTEKSEEIKEENTIVEKIKEEPTTKVKKVSRREPLRIIQPKLSARLKMKVENKVALEKLQVAANDTKEETMEIDPPASDEPTSSVDGSGSCSCKFPCHSRIGTVSQHLNNACSQLDGFIKLKRREENKLLKNFLDMLKEIHMISENKDVTGESKISDHILIPEDTSQKRKASKRKSSDIETPSKETPRKKNAEEKSPVKSEKKSNVEFKDLKGLAVFAKWPNSGWYYPGKVEELTGKDWKDANNVTVKFYDGLVREMKNINILPAYLIPPGSMMCDLEDETEMLVISCDGSNQNSVEFKLSVKDSDNSIELNFNKLAIRANNMKIIKQQLEPTTDVVPKKMHMVSLDNLVSGRRSRVRSKKDLEAEETTPTRPERRSTSTSSASSPMKKVATPKRGRN